MSDPQSMESLLTEIRAVQVPDSPERSEAIRAHEAFLRRSYQDFSDPEESARRCGVPDAYRVATFERCPAQVCELAKKSVQAKRVVFSGPAAAGKTCLAVCMMRLRYAIDRSVRFAHSHRLGTARIQSPAGTGEADYVRRALRVKLLLLDDLGNERQTETNAVPDVIVERHAMDLATWITTGLTHKEIATRYGDGIRRRVFEGAVVIALGVR